MTATTLHAPMNNEAVITRERIAGFLFGIGLGTAIGFFLKTPHETGRQRTPAERSEVEPSYFR